MRAAAAQESRLRGVSLPAAAPSAPPLRPGALHRCSVPSGRGHSAALSAAGLFSSAVLPDCAARALSVRRGAHTHIGWKGWGELSDGTVSKNAVKNDVTAIVTGKFCHLTRSESKCGRAQIIPFLTQTHLQDTIQFRNSSKVMEERKRTAGYVLSDFTSAD